MRVLLVRHVHAGVRGTWPGSDLDRELSDRGRRQAAAIADQFADEAIVAVHSSSAVRCVDSVVPLAEALGLEVEIAPPLLEGGRPAAALAWLEALSGGPDDVVVACSHGDIIGGVLERLADRGTPLDGSLAWPKAGTWDLTVDDGLVVTGKPIAPPAV